jgi:signal transduction histidine kinase/CheY-like chemotaxis protein
LALNADLVIVAVSDGYLRDAGASRADVVGRGVLSILPESAAGPGLAGLRASLDRVSRDGVADTMAVQRYDIRRPASEGGGLDVRYVSRVNSPVLDAGGGLACIVHTVTDVTEDVRRQEAGQALRANQDARDQFLSRVNHELRTPLNTIFGFGELLSCSDITAEHREWTSMMLQAARRLLGLLDEVVDISRTDAEQLSLSIEAVSVQDAIADALEIIRPLAISRGVQLDSLPRLRASQYAAADVQRLRQVLVNLLSNAIKYNHPSGHVSISVDDRAAGRLRISIADTGRGIREDQLSELFVPFERLDAAQAGIKGTGLGLALSRQLIEKMGGETGVTSTYGEGSIFWIELPATEPIAVTQAAIGHDPIVTSRSYPEPRTVLYVEDMVENLRLVEQVLKQRPSTTLIPAMLAGVALDLARQHRPDLILLDAHLPDMPGQDVIRQLRADPITCGIPIIILSGDTAQPTIDQLLAAGATAYLTKPIQVRQLLQAVDQVLDRALPDLVQSTRAAEGAVHQQGIPINTSRFGD